MPNNNFRENKYLNESGTKTGRWYLNRLDYFQFNEYPEYKRHKYFALFFGLLIFYSALKLLAITIIGSLLLIYLSYITLMTYYLLRTKICRYNGYFLYPKKFVNFFKLREVEVDLHDFDSIATLSKK